MPNHVHVLIRQYEGAPLAWIVQSWKSYTGRRIAALGFGLPREKGRGRVVWRREYWDRYVRDERHLRSVVGYIHGNPVRAGLVGRVEEWRWSSAGRGSAELGLGGPGE